MVGRGEPEENRRKAEAFGVEFPVVLQPGWRLSKQYGIFATPVAFLIDEEGVIERDVARGPTEILELCPRGAERGKEGAYPLDPEGASSSQEGRGGHERGESHE